MSQRFHSLKQNPKIPNYRNDGAGRDTYISFYNGGFGRYKLSDTYFKEKNDSPKHIYHQDLALCKPTKRYFTDGGGRDLYVYNSLLDENDKFKGNLRLNNILRSYDNIQYPIKTSKNISPSKFEKKLLNRIFYGKCPGLKDRLMSPKVKFLKKDEINKHSEENEEYEKDNGSFGENKEEKSFDIEYKNNNSNDINKYNSYLTENNSDQIKNITGMNYNNNIFNQKKTPKKFRPEVGQNDHLVNSVKKIFLYNNKNKQKTLYNNININNLKKKDNEKIPIV